MGRVIFFLLSAAALRHRRKERENGEKREYEPNALHMKKVSKAGTTIALVDCRRRSVGGLAALERADSRFE